MRENINFCHQLRVYQNARLVAMELFQLSKSFPPEEKYSLTDQMRRSSRSVCANIAESWMKRHYPASFVSKLSDALGEANETWTWIEFAADCGYLKADLAAGLKAKYTQILAQLMTMSKSPSDWTTR